jgi:hypothetical protein
MFGDTHAYLRTIAEWKEEEYVRESNWVAICLTPSHIQAFKTSFQQPRSTKLPAEFFTATNRDRKYAGRGSALVRVVAGLS